MSFLKDKKLFIAVAIFSFVLISGFKLVKENEVIGLKHPESAFFYNGYLYVSNIGSSPISQNEDGFITKLDEYGNILEYKFIDKLKAPKGIFAYDGKLYIADLDRLCIYDLKKKSLSCRPIESSRFLNDICVVDGDAYITDTENNLIYRVDKKGRVDVFYRWDYDFAPNGIVFLKSKGVFFVVSFNSPTIEMISRSGKPLKSFKLKGLTGFDGICVANGKVFVSDYTRGEVIQTDTSFDSYTLIRSFKTPVADLCVFDDELFAPLIEKNKLLIGRIR
ncbi:hypothetical protein [Hippea sp. KM1]|uniref:hypothetical protein n=1 Tax=Hippea sp. KM1 TaxID=944481 RepID=UPI00046D01CB|nr:hypothetical protein [Hippea sp. KM1]